MALLLEQKGVDLSKARVMAGKLRKKNKRIALQADRRIWALRGVFRYGNHNIKEKKKLLYF